MSQFFQYQRLFEELSSIEASKKEGRLSYSEELFNVEPYFLKKDVKEKTEVSLTPCTTESIDSDAKPKEVSEKHGEKVDLLKNFSKFVESKVEKTGKPFRFPGGEIQVQEDSHSKDKVIVQEAQFDQSVFVDPISDSLKVLFIGESPKDFKAKEPRSSLLYKMIQAMNLQEGEFSRVFLDPSMPELWPNCLALIWDKIPQVIVSLGAYGTNHLLKKKEKLSKIHGKKHPIEVEYNEQVKNITVFPLFHPDILTINPNMKRSAWIDLQEIMKFLDKKN